MSNELGTNFLQAFERMIQDIRGKRLIFFVAGRTGWGKSSTVNLLLGENKCEVHHNKPATKEVAGVDFEMKGVKCTIFDTPGFCDGSGNDDAYIKMIRDKVKTPDSMLYVSRLDETRLENDERVIKIISEALGHRVWENAVIIFTFACKLEASEYLIQFKEKTELVQKEIAKYLPDKEKNIAFEIPAVAIDNKTKKTPDGKECLGNLFTAVVERVSKKGTIAILSMLTESINQRTKLSSKQKEIIRKKFVDAVFHSATAAMGIGVVIAGLINSPVIIGFSAGGIVGTLIGTWLSKSDDE